MSSTAIIQLCAACLPLARPSTAAQALRVDSVTHGLAPKGSSRAVRPTALMPSPLDEDPVPRRWIRCSGAICLVMPCGQSTTDDGECTPHANVRGVVRCGPFHCCRDSGALLMRVPQVVMKCAGQMPECLHRSCMHIALELRPLVHSKRCIIRNGAWQQQ